MKFLKLIKIFKNERLISPLFLRAFIPLVLSSIFFLNINSAFAKKKSLVILKDIIYNSENEEVKIITSDFANIKYNRLKNPDRIYIDILGSKLSVKFYKNKKKYSFRKNGKIQNLWYAQNTKDKVRIVLQTESKLKYNILRDKKSNIIVSLKDALLLKSLKGKKNSRKKYETKKQVKKEKKPLKSKSKEEITIIPAIKVKEKKQKTKLVKLQKKTIVIDPGHGGKDPGALGKNGLREKDVVLDIALKLAKILRKSKKYNVILTRDKDVFIPVRERPVIANKFNADLFISIHINADTNKRSKGLETYYLSRTTSRKALEIAARENMTTIKDLEQNDLEFILADLRSTFKINESIKFSNLLQKELIGGLKPSYKNLRNLGAKKAPFYVLLGANMPAVLVEALFVTNKEEAVLLRKSSTRRNLAKSIYKGITRYLDETILAYKTN